MTARFYVNDEERESREVTEKWLFKAWVDENVVLKDGNTYRFVDCDFTSVRGESFLRVDLEAPRVTLAG